VSWTERRRGGVTMLELASGRSGPLVTVLAGVHGDEHEPIRAAAELAAAAPALARGTLRLVPVVNESAWRAGRRRAPEDGADLARCFPGSATGSFSERLAATVWELALDGADVLLDLHSAGTHYAMPLLAGYLDDGGRGAALAAALGLPVVWRHDVYGPGRTVTAMAERGRVALYTECGGGPQADPANVAAYVAAVHRLLGALDMAPAQAAGPRALVVDGGGNLDRDVVRAACDGLFLPAVRAGEVVDAGAEIGRIASLRNETLERVTAPRRAAVMMLRRTTSIRLGDVVVAYADLST
jgi:predicted deacylase